MGNLLLQDVTYENEKTAWGNWRRYAHSISGLCSSHDPSAGLVKSGGL